MNWLAFSALVILTFVMQSTLAVRLEIFGVRPDWMLVVMVFYAMHARAPQCIVAGWFMGLLADCATLERAGLVSVTYGLTATLVTLVREYVFRFGWISQLLVTVGACFFVRVLWFLYRLVVYGAYESAMFDVGKGIVLTAIYTGLWAPPMHFALLRFAKALGVPRRKHVYGNTR